MELLWFFFAAAAVCVTIPLWRLALKRRTKLTLTLALAITCVSFSVALPTSHQRTEVRIAVVLLGLMVLTFYVALYLLLRLWLVDRADIARLRGTAQRNADQISVVSHEIRTPLALMKGASDLLAEGSPGPLTPAQHRFVATISSNCHTVIDLAQDLLIQARIDAGIFHLHLQRVNFRTLATGVIKELRQLHATDIALDCPGAPPRAWADTNLIRQALTNLINNAVAQACQATLITVRIVNADQQILVSVSDDGSGMSATQRQQLFERFASGRPLRDGTGLGLVITRQIIQMHGGDVFVDSTPPHGTTMLFSIPTGEHASVGPQLAERVVGA